MSTEVNNILKELSKHHDTCLQIASNLLYYKNENLVQDIVQQMYLNIYDQIEDEKLNANQIIINAQLTKYNKDYIVKNHTT